MHISHEYIVNWLIVLHYFGADLNYKYVGAA